jgi:PEP-CTERM motif
VKIAKLAPAILVFVLLLAPCIAHAQTTLTFNAPFDTVNTTFADGTFSSNLSNFYNPVDGFYTIDSTTAFNGFGMSGESITFNSPATVFSLLAIGGATQGCCSNDFDSLTLSLYDSSNVLLASTVDVSPTSQVEIDFNLSGVSRIVFNVTGGIPNYEGSGFPAAWYVVSDIKYSTDIAATPEPGTFLLFASGILGMVLLACKRSAN